MKRTQQHHEKAASSGKKNSSLYFDVSKLLFSPYCTLTHLTTVQKAQLRLVLQRCGMHSTIALKFQSQCCAAQQMVRQQMKGQRDLLSKVNTTHYVKNHFHICKWFSFCLISHLRSMSSFHAPPLHILTVSAEMRICSSPYCLSSL